MRASWAAFALSAALLAATALAAPRADGEAAADLVLTGGKVVTVDPRETVAQAVAVRGGRIVAVGSAVDIATWKGADTQTIDLAGRALLPGFIDAHSHIGDMANIEGHFTNVQAPPLKDAQAVIDTLKAVRATKPKGAWLLGQGTYNQVMPTRAQLDAAFPDNPVRLDWSAHDHLINHAAAVAMGMGKNFPDPPPGSTGHYERTADGEIAIIRDAPAPWPRVEFTYDQMKEAARSVLQRYYLEKGVTTVSDMSYPSIFRAYQELRADGRLPTRVRMNYFIRDGKTELPLLATLRATGLHTGLGDDMLRVGAVKLILDGAWGTTVALYRPQWKGASTSWMPDNYGGTSVDQPTLNKFVLDARQGGWQVQIHAEGDRAQDMALDAFEAADRIAPSPDARDRIEHLGNFLIVDPKRSEARFQRIMRDKVIASVQPAFLWRLTSTNAKEPDVVFFPLRDLIDRGMHPAGGVDTGGTQMFATYPMFSIERAVARTTKFGQVIQPEQKITVMEGIKMFTIWSAEANFLEKELGSIEVGKLADLVVLHADPLTTAPSKLAEIPVDMTIIAGKVAYRR